MFGAALTQSALKQLFPSEGAATVSGWNILTWLVSLVKRMGDLMLSGAGFMQLHYLHVESDHLDTCLDFLEGQKKKKKSLD